MLLRKIVFYTQMQGPGAFPFNENHLEQLRRISPETEFVFVGWNDEKLLCEAEGCDAAVAQNNHPLPTVFYERAKDLKWVHCLMSGVDRMRCPGSEHVLLTASIGTHSIPLSEHILALILSAARKLYVSRDCQKQKAWIRPDGITELRGSKVGIVGLGHIGTEAARLLSTLGMEVVATGRSAPKPEQASLIKRFYPKERFDAFLSICDYVVLCIPLTEETKNMFGAEQFRKMKRSAWIVNVARGAIINEAELVDALNVGEIAGACLDVAPEEPRPATDPLWDMPNVILTPHTANETPRKMDRIVTLLEDNIYRYLHDEPLLGAVPNYV